MPTPSTQFYVLNGGRDGTDGKWYFGRVRMFFINKFTHHEELNICYDKSLDVKAIEKAFTKLQFKVDKPIVNLTKDEMIACLQKNIDYFGCPVIFVFSHGEQNYIYCKDYDEKTEAGKLDIWYEYYHHFSGQNKPEMQNCPKVFFNELCQGSGKSNSENVSQKKPSSSFHNTAHWLIYNAALPRYDAYIDVDKGSFSTQSFCRCLNEFAETKDLEEIMKLVYEDITNIRVPLKNCYDNYMQPIITSTLKEKLYLLPPGKVHQLMSVYRREFEHIEVLGKGNFGVVFKARNLHDQVEYAIKRIQILESTESEKSRYDYKSEIQSLAKFSKCPQIVGYNRVWEEFAEFDCQKNEDHNRKISGLIKPVSNIIYFCFIQMELCGETLEFWLKRNAFRIKVQSFIIFQQILQGLSHIHKENIVHRDLKPTNILFAITNNENDLCVRIADFGLAKHVGNSFTTTYGAGTFLYMAPEILRNKFYTKSDMYSVGLILIELLYNCSGEDHDNILNDAKDSNFPEPFQNELKFALPTVEKLLSYKVDDRPTCDELLNTLSTIPQLNEAFSTTTMTVKFKGHCQQQEELQLASTCTGEEHLLNEYNQWISTTKILWNAEKHFSDWFILPAVDNTNTRWEVRLTGWSDNSFRVFIHCLLLDEQFRATSVRLFAAVEQHPQVWAEAAMVLKSGEDRWCYFSKGLDMPLNSTPITVRVCVQWSEFDQLPDSSILSSKCEACIRCRWRIQGWKNVSPTADWWGFYSEPIERNGLVWRLVVLNRPNDKVRRVEARVWLQHVPSTAKIPGLTMTSSLSLWDQHFDEKRKDIRPDSCSIWTVINDVNLESRDPFDLKVNICLNR